MRDYCSNDAIDGSNKQINNDFARLSSTQGSQAVPLEFGHTSNEQRVSGGRGRWIKLPFLLLVIALFTVTAINWRQTFAIFEVFLEFVADHPIPGSLIIFAIYVVLPMICMPVYLIAIGAGYIFYDSFGTLGLVIICALTFLGTSLGALLAFLVSRYLLKDCMLRLAEKHTKFRIIQALAEQNGVKIVVVCRLTPLVPFVIINYMLGSIPKLKTKSFIIGNLAMIPRSITMPMFGSTLSKLSETANRSQSISQEPVSLITMIFGAVVVLMSSVWFTIQAKKEFQRLQANLQITTPPDPVESVVELQEENAVTAV